MRLLIVLIAHENHGAGVVGCWGRKAYAGYFLWQQCHPRESRRRGRKPHVGYIFVEHGGTWLARNAHRALGAAQWKVTCAVKCNAYRYNIRVTVPRAVFEIRTCTFELHTFIRTCALDWG